MRARARVAAGKQRVYTFGSGQHGQLGHGNGADVLRLWVASVDYTGDVMIGPGIMRQVADTYRKLRGTLRFLLGNLSDYEGGVREVVSAAAASASASCIDASYRRARSKTEQ